MIQWFKYYFNLSDEAISKILQAYSMLKQFLAGCLAVVFFIAYSNYLFSFAYHMGIKCQKESYDEDLTNAYESGYDAGRKAFHNEMIKEEEGLKDGKAITPKRK